jgi:hypothetical protein
MHLKVYCKALAMTSYSEQLVQRKQDATAADASLVAHFGPEAHDCTNWNTLWQRGWREVLTNASPTDTYQPKGLPPSGLGGWVSKDGRQAEAYPPSLYSDKFPFHFVKQLANGPAELIATVDSWLDYEDDIDCDQLLSVIGRINGLLHQNKLSYLIGTGYIKQETRFDIQQQDALLQNVSSRDGKIILVSGVGVAIPNEPVIKHDFAMGMLQGVCRQIEVLRQEFNNKIQEQTSQSVPTDISEQKGETPQIVIQRNSNLTHRQIALLYIYRDTPLDEAIATEVGKKYGHDSATTGRKIMTDHYHPLRGKANNRTGVEGKTAIANMSKAIRGVIPHLPEDKRQQAEDELQVLEGKR